MRSRAVVAAFVVAGLTIAIPERAPAQSAKSVDSGVVYVKLVTRAFPPTFAGDTALVRAAIQTGVEAEGRVRLAKFPDYVTAMTASDARALMPPDASLMITATLTDSAGSLGLQLRAIVVETAKTLELRQVRLFSTAGAADEAGRLAAKFAYLVRERITRMIPATFVFDSPGFSRSDSMAVLSMIADGLGMNGRLHILPLQHPRAAELLGEQHWPPPITPSLQIKGSFLRSAGIELTLAAEDLSGRVLLARRYKIGASTLDAAAEGGRDSAEAFARELTSRTKVVMLGTGTPIPDPDRAGPAVAIVVDSVAYLFDAGAGVVRRAAAAGRDGVAAFGPRIKGGQPSPRFDRVFITHLHSDHTLGLADVIFTPWIQGRVQPLDIYGPPGIKRLVSAILDGNAEDIAERVSSSGGPSPSGWKAVVHDVAEGEVFRDARITVTAFAVPHSGWKYAFGYRIQTPDRVIVLSGDARPNAAVSRQCNGCDILIHEVYSTSGFATIPAERQKYHAQAHTSAAELGDIATQARPGMLILYHQLFFGASEETLLSEVRARYSGKVVSAHDLDVY